MGFLRNVHGVTLRNKVRNCEISKVLKVEPLLHIARSQPLWVGHVSKISQHRLARQVLLATPTGKRPRVRPRTRWVITSPTLLGPVLVWSQQNYQDCCWSWDILNLRAPAPWRNWQEAKGEFLPPGKLNLKLRPLLSLYFDIDIVCVFRGAFRQIRVLV